MDGCGWLMADQQNGHDKISLHDDTCHLVEVRDETDPLKKRKGREGDRFFFPKRIFFLPVFFFKFIFLILLWIYNIFFFFSPFYGLPFINTPTPPHHINLFFFSCDYRWKGGQHRGGGELLSGMYSRTFQVHWTRTHLLITNPAQHSLLKSHTCVIQPNIFL